MSTGRVTAVVGPSGVGNDDMMAVLAEACPHFQVVRRAIARAAGLGGENCRFVTGAAFARHVDLGAFCLNWTAKLCPSARRQRFARAPKSANPS